DGRRRHARAEARHPAVPDASHRARSPHARGAHRARRHRAVPGAEQSRLRRAEHRRPRPRPARDAGREGRSRLRRPHRRGRPAARRGAPRGTGGPLMAALVALEDVALGYGGRPVLEGVSFAVERGDFAALLGPNGAGKTTLFRGMLGLIPVLRGRIDYGFDRRLEPPGYVPQKETLDPIFPLTVTEVVVMGTYARLAPLRPVGRRER